MNLTNFTMSLNCFESFISGRPSKGREVCHSDKGNRNHDNMSV